MTKDEALKLVQEALEALENISIALREDDVLGSDIELMLNTISKIHAALAQPARQWVELTDEEMESTCAGTWSYDPHVIARAIEAKLKEKNT